MADPTTTNKFLAQPLRGSDIGVWDTPMNSNASIIDNSFGGVTAVALTNANVSLSSAQYQCQFVNFTGALSANVQITFPAVGSFYTLQNLTTNTSAFYITLTTTAAGGQVIGLPPGNPTSIFTDGTNVKFYGLPHVGSWWDYAGSSVPSWLSVCTVPPWLNCDGTTFSSATYPVLATVLGSATLPDSKGRARFALNQGSARLTSSQGGLDGNTNYTGGGSQTTTLSSQNVPPVPITDPGHVHIFNPLVGGATPTEGSGSNGPVNTSNPLTTSSAVTNITAGSTSPTPFANVPPALVAGLMFIRAA